MYIYNFRDFEKIDLYSSNEGCLSIPFKVQIFFVNTVQKLMFVENELVQCEASDFSIIGLDSEWSPYVSSSRYFKILKIMILLLKFFKNLEHQFYKLHLILVFTY